MSPAVELATHEWPPADGRADAPVEGRAMADVEGILASLRADTGVRVLDLAPGLTVPTLLVLADEERSVVGAARRTLIERLPPSVRVREFDCGHTVHRDRIDDYLAAIRDFVA